jgi:hypothetical protein
MEIILPDTMPAAIMVERQTAQFFLERNLAEWGNDGPVAMAWRWALTGQGPRPICGASWSGRLPTREDLVSETRMDSGWGYLATWKEVTAAKFVLWWLTAAPQDEVPQRFRQTAQLHKQFMADAADVQMCEGW